MKLIDATVKGPLVWTILFLLALVLRGEGNVMAATVELNGYLFSDMLVDLPDVQDSAMLSGNTYFTDYPRTVDLNFQLYGYGDFKGYERLLNYKQTMLIGGVQCSVIMEQGDLPTFSTSDGATSFDMELYTAYYYYARDINDNIHVLRVEIMPVDPAVTSMEWDYTELPSGGTTLLYPDAPVIGQQVFGGRIADTSAEINGVSSDALVIEFDDLPYGYPGPVTEYLLPGSGLFAVAYDWDGGVNGFSRDRKSPVRDDEDEKAWEEWWDDHCFISSCRRQA